MRLTVQTVRTTDVDVVVDDDVADFAASNYFGGGAELLEIESDAWRRELRRVVDVVLLDD
jgi:hypothetical protein